jgi:hypothetical protein
MHTKVSVSFTIHSKADSRGFLHCTCAFERTIGAYDSQARPVAEFWKRKNKGELKQ